MPCIFRLAELGSAEILEVHLGAGHAPFPRHLLPVVYPADPSLEFRELVAHQILPQHPIFTASVEDRQSGIPVFAMKMGVPPGRRSRAQIIAVSFQSEEPYGTGESFHGFVLSAVS